MKYYLIAGEASGDLHGSNLMKGLYAEDAAADMRFWGGPLMDAVYKDHQDGEGLAHDYKDGAVIGFSQVVARLGSYAKELGDCLADIRKFHPDVVILIDYPGFNFRVAEAAHKEGFKVFYYIAPKVWASRENRVKKIKAYVDKLFIVFPFEKPYFDKKGVSYVYKGNPLIDAIDGSEGLKMSHEEITSMAGVPDKPYIAILAGSRKGEVSSMMDTCVEFADKLRAVPEYASWNFLVAGAPSRSMEDYAGAIGGRDYIKVLFGQTHAILKNAEAAVVNSGTASLETCLIGTPQVVAYAGSNFNYLIGRQIIKVPYISLGNLILGRKAFKELMNPYFTSDNLISEVRRLIEDGEYRDKMIADYADIRESLGGRGASRAVARAMVEELK